MAKGYAQTHTPPLSTKRYSSECKSELRQTAILRAERQRRAFRIYSREKRFAANAKRLWLRTAARARWAKTHQYYACKKKKKGECTKHREEKERLEFYVTQMVRDFLSDKENAEIAVRDTLKYYDKRTGADNIKSLETRIAKAHKDIEEMTTAFIEAKSALLRESIEKRMTEYEILIKDLESQKTQLEYERGLQVSESDLLDYIAELLKGNPADKDYQKQLIDNLVYKVFIDDDNIIPILTIGNGKEIENVRLSEVKEVLGKLYGTSVQTQLPLARQKRIVRTHAKVSSYYSLKEITSAFALE